MVDPSRPDQPLSEPLSGDLPSEPPSGALPSEPLSGDLPSEQLPPGGGSARDLVRRRSRSYARDETGRHHHIGAAPESQPLHTEEGASRIGTSAVQLASRTAVQLGRQRERTVTAMAAAAQDLRFEDAARLRDDLAALDAELERRSAAT